MKVVMMETLNTVVVPHYYICMLQTWLYQYILAIWQVPSSLMKRPGNGTIVAVSILVSLLALKSQDIDMNNCKLYWVRDNVVVT